jgi:hypothetical protein
MAVRRVIAIDPGKMTGMCCFTWEDGKEPVLEWAIEIDEDGYANPIRYEFLNNPEIEIACERFIINAETAKKTQAPYSLELIGVLKQCVRDVKRPLSDINLQAPVDAKKMFPNTALKKLDYWYVGGGGHALDAIRHALLYMAKNGWKPKRLLE